jgi:hypothetical protein
MPAGHFIPLANSRYVAVPPAVMAATMQVMLMIHLFMASPVLHVLRAGSFDK